MSTIHVSVAGGFGPDPAILGDDVPYELGMCCEGAAALGPGRCTCWKPVISQWSAPPTLGPSAAQAKCCHDCAFRNDSPETEDGLRDDLAARARAGGEPFYCHQGMAYIEAWQHPTGLVLPARPGNYQPPRHGTTPYQVDGTPGLVCAGWLAHTPTVAA